MKTMGDLANEYWQARWAHDEEKAKAISLEMDALFDEQQAVTEFAGVAIPDDLKKACAIQPGSLTEWDDAACILYRSAVGTFSDGPGRIDVRLEKLGFKYVYEWSDGFRSVWVRDTGDGGQIVTYCEGDVNVTIHPTAESLVNKLASARIFYEDH